MLIFKAGCKPGSKSENNTKMNEVEEPLKCAGFSSMAIGPVIGCLLHTVDFRTAPINGQAKKKVLAYIEMRWILHPDLQNSG